MAQSAITPAQKSLINEFMSLNIEAKQFAVVMSQKYDYYYDNNDDYDYADVKLFDALLFQRNTPIRNFIDEVCKARMDIMSSDRECAAFIAAIHYFVYEYRPDNDTTPAVELPAASEFMSDTFKHVGNVDKTKYMCVVIIGQCCPNAPQLRFVYHGNRRAAKEYFTNMLEATIEGRPERRSYDYESIYCMVDNFTGEKYAMTIKDAQKTEQTRRWLASQKAMAAAFPRMPLQLPAITESAIYEAADTASEETTPSPVKNANMLQDWGEKIGGARKDEATNHNPAPVPTKKLKYGLTFTVTSCSNELLWHIKTSPRRYSLCAFVRYGDKSAIYQGKVNEYIEEAERLLIEKYPNFENLYNFDIYHIPIKGYVIRAKRVKIDIATLPTREEATAFLLSEKPQIYLQVAKANRPTEQKNRAAALVVRNSINRPRLGTDYVQGDNITPEELATTFGLRAVEFGNWMTADDRQTSINECYNSFCVLAELLKIDRYQIGRGTLAVAFGARGTGKANAHYEPTRHVINLTRTRGAGSLAHEWAHSIDFDGTLQKKLSRNFWFKGYSLRSKSVGSYWGKEEEQFARAFETAIHYELKGREVIDDYLVNIIADCPVYPTASENERIAPYVIEKIKTALQ